MFSIQYFRHKLHQTPKVTVFSSSLAQTISFIFRHAMNRNKEHKICFNGEHLRQHNTSQRCHFSHEYVQYSIHRLQDQIKGCAYGNSYHYKTSTLWKPEHITLEQSKDHRLCIKKLIWPKLEVCFRLRCLTLDMSKSFHCMPKASECLVHHTQLHLSSLTSASLEHNHPFPNLT